MRSKLGAACLGAMLCAAVSLSHAKAQTVESGAAAGSSSPSAWVYVTVQETVNGNAQHSRVMAFQADSEGRLTAIPGSPFADDVCCTAVNGQYFFGADWGGYGSNIPAYTIESNAALSYSTSSDALADDDGCGFTGPVFFDHTGSTLYMYDGDEGLCPASRIRSFSVNKDNGKLTLLGDVSNIYLPPTLTFSGNNQFAYGQGGVVATGQGF
jgi:6-phosphogluconolactonase (cycloisomerase 2 family)